MTKLATLVACLGLFLASLAAAPLPSPDSLLKQLDWLTGRWVLHGQCVELSRSPARNDALIGSSRWEQMGEVWLQELLSIEVGQAGLTLNLRHLGRGLQSPDSEPVGPLRMSMSRIGESQIVFEDPASDDPRRILFTREGDTLTLRLEDAAGDVTGGFALQLDA